MAVVTQHGKPDRRSGHVPGPLRATTRGGAGGMKPARLAMVGVWAFLIGSMVCWAQVTAANEYEVKAAYLYNFAKFVEWPDSPSAGSRERLTIAVLGRDPFGSVLDQVIADKTVRGKRISVRRVSNVDEALDCQIIFIGTSEERRLGELIRALEGKSVLTIGETGQFAHRGGIIGFRIEDNKVRFDVNIQAAERARLVLSSQLLKLAHIVTEGPGS
jgi:hypothetical protein